MGQEFTQRLAEVLDQRAQRLQSQEIVNLKEELRIYHSAFEGLTDFLYRNAIVSEDPYGQEHKISSVEAPENSRVTENEKEHKLSSRLSFYNAMLDYVNNYYQFSVVILNIPELKRLSEMVNFWQWSQLSPNSTHYTTQLLGQFVQKLKGNVESMAGSIVKENLNQLIRSQRKIASYLKTIGAYQRELYKLRVRQNLTDNMGIPRIEPHQANGIVSKVKDAYKSTDMREPFYSELVRELIEEDYTESGNQTREQKLQNLGEKESQKKTREKRDDSAKKALLESVHSIARASRHLEEAVTKLQDTSEAYESRKRGLWTRIKRWLEKTAQGSAKKLVYHISYADITTSARHTEEIEFNKLMTEISAKARQLAGIQTPNSRAAARIEGASEEQIIAYLTKTIEQVQMFHRSLNSLDQFFKANMPPEQKARLRGIKIELSSIRGAIQEANQFRHEYVSKQEEVQQMKKLGVDVDE